MNCAVDIRFFETITHLLRQYPASHSNIKYNVSTHFHTSRHFHTKQACTPTILAASAFPSPAMASSKLKVVITGASGHTGVSIMNQLLAAPAQFEVTALARTESINKQIYKGLAARDALVKPANLQDVDAVATMLSGADVIISCMTRTSN
ncbi:hypothetical protein MCOR27_004713 [Pyricularia oryzae]|nr:hypothetical protein MCOR19_002350 [Pyricularia oryzae]KAI6269681.1 hypothetical protein MCOR26_008599 [Pyricularia oryzae]KAI6280293.1 hypothetical protein MCOR27_004713 [Pyricularia oryzae]KAI6329183.1 hypothetical protein MCOR29_002309 [Pyricularia oryzae]KAI6347860.1 hypothetical protein MCOR28_002029 [Pyricularia oryzae]